MVLSTIGLAGVRAQGQAPLHESQYSDADIAYGAALYTSKCVTCHGTQGDGIGGVNLRSGTFRNAVIDRDLERFIRAGSPAGMPPFMLDNAEMAGIIAYLRNMNAFDAAAVKIGDAARGRAIFDGKGGCTSCHRIGVAGSRVAPNLSDIGATRSAGSLQRSLVDPTSQMMPINRPVRVVTKDGTIINGRRLNEDTYTLQLIDDRERFHSLVKADLREYTISKTSPMPSYKRHALRRRDCRRARVSAFDERTVAMTGKRRLFVWSFVSLIGLLTFRVQGQVTLAAPGRRGQRAAELADLLRQLLQHALQPAVADHAGQRQEPEAAMGLPVAGRRQLADDAAGRRRHDVHHPASERRRRARRATGRAFWIYRYTPAQDRIVCCGANNRGPRDSRRHAVHGHARRAASSPSTRRRGAPTGRPRSPAPNRDTRSRTRRWSSRTRSSSASAAASTASAASSPPTTRRRDARRGASTRFRRRVSPVPKRGSAVLLRRASFCDPEAWKHGGGSIWLTGSYDPQLNLTYWGVGNVGPDYNGAQRPGDNLYTDFGRRARCRHRQAEVALPVHAARCLRLRLGANPGAHRQLGGQPRQRG